MSLPTRLLNSTAVIYSEQNTKDAMGAPVQSLVATASVFCRCDLKSQSRDASPIEQTSQTARVYFAGSRQLTTSNWIKVTAQGGKVLFGQVTSVSEPGLQGHHTAADITIRTPVPPIV